MKNVKFYVGHFSVIIFFVLQNTHIIVHKLDKCIHLNTCRQHMTHAQLSRNAQKQANIKLLTEWEHKAQRVHMLVCSCESLVSLCVVYASQSSSPGAVYLSIHSHADHRRLSRGGFMTRKLFPRHRFNLILYWRTSCIDDPHKWRKVQELVQLCWNVLEWIALNLWRTNHLTSL